ncbi:MAG: PAS domain S-box protein, partial [Ramlibacter sp.]
MADNDFSTLFDLLPIGAYRAEPGGRQLRANHALVRIYGFASEAQALEIFNSLDRRWYVEDRRREQFRELLAAHGKVRNFVSEVFRDHGRQRIWVAENAHMVRDAAGNALYYEGTVEDITERRTNELALQANEKSFRELSDALQMTLHSVAQGIMKINADGQIVFFSQRALELLDLPESLLSARPTLAEVTHFQQERGDFGEQFERIEHADGRV